MKSSNIGGQAVMEGVMMRNKNKYAVAVRLTNNEINVDVKEEKVNLDTVNKIPIVRGMVTFIHSLYIGISSLMLSASYFEEEEDNKPKTKEEEKKAERKEKVEMGGTLIFSFVLALGIFVVIPFYLSKIFSMFIESASVIALIEGIIRVLIFILYILLISKMEDIKRVFMYHGAEHKCINCIEHGMELNVENVKLSSRLHKRCGTSFVFIVFLISVFVFMFIRMDSRALQLLCRILLMPVIAGISYEFIRAAGRSDSKIVDALSKPGLMLQKITTAEPDDDMIEVGIASVEAVFDWKQFLKDNEGDF